MPAIDTPSSGYALAVSERGDFLALSLRFTLDEVIAVVLETEGDLPEQILGGRLPEESMETADRNLPGAAVRLLSILDEPVAYMGRHIKGEILFQALCGSCGRPFLQSMLSIRTAEEIYAANRWIKQNFRKTFSVEQLAEQGNMSVSAFHQKFKSAVGMGPLQCQKRLRLTEARRLMLDEAFRVTDAALEVGYESVSQFIRLSEHVRRPAGGGRAGAPPAAKMRSALRWFRMTPLRPFGLPAPQTQTPHIPRSHSPAPPPTPMPPAIFP